MRDPSRPRVTKIGVGLFVAVFTFVVVFCLAHCVGDNGISTDFCVKMLASLVTIVVVAPALTSRMRPEGAMPATCFRPRAFFRPPRLLPSWSLSRS